MFRSSWLLSCFLLACAVGSTTMAAPGAELIDPTAAKKNADFLAQGEYLGQGVWPGGDKTAIGAQVIALGGHKFRVVLHRGGLPGAGWRRGDDRLFWDGVLADEVVTLVGKNLPGGKIVGDLLTLDTSGGKPTISLKRTERKSTTLGAKPPAGAIVLFDGTSADHFKNAKITDLNSLEAGTSLKKQLKMAQLHLEFRLSWKPKARGQDRSNSGVYLGGIPEIQVLDSFGLEGAKNECGALYGRRVPDVNMCLPPLVWQTYDVEFHRPKLGPGGKPTGNVTVTVRHNGVVIHDCYDTRRKTLGPGGMHLQRHGNRVQYRNIWLVQSE
jgi:hypothetical protein